MNSRIITKNHETYPEIRVSHKIDFKAVWPRNGHAASLGVRLIGIISKFEFRIKIFAKYLRL